ncbi:hypothetical protein HZ326_7913 [Fusarium oxysporum f. sp. albedinis]|nr:hypothetical protein HZ326_7913 [Fusarium oxysporum f. sp. albedinis]
MRGTRFHDGPRSHGSPRPNFVFLPLRGLTAILNPHNFKTRSIDCAVNSSRLPSTSPRLVRAGTHGHDHSTVPSRLAPFSATPKALARLDKVTL